MCIQDAGRAKVGKDFGRPRLPSRTANSQICKHLSAEARRLLLLGELALRAGFPAESPQGCLSHPRLCPKWRSMPAPARFVEVEPERTKMNDLVYHERRCIQWRLSS